MKYFIVAFTLTPTFAKTHQFGNANNALRSIHQLCILIQLFVVNTGGWGDFRAHRFLKSHICPVIRGKEDSVTYWRRKIVQQQFGRSGKGKVFSIKQIDPILASGPAEQHPWFFTNLDFPPTRPLKNIQYKWDHTMIQTCLGMKPKCIDCKFDHLMFPPFCKFSKHPITPFFFAIWWCCLLQL